MKLGVHNLYFINFSRIELSRCVGFKKTVRQRIYAYCFFILILATGTGKRSRENAQFDDFDFQQKFFLVRFISELNRNKRTSGNPSLFLI